MCAKTLNKDVIMNFEMNNKKKAKKLQIMMHTIEWKMQLKY